MGFDPSIIDIEDAFESHWRRFGLYPGARLDDTDGVLRIESPIAHLPYNAVVRTRIPPGSDAAAIAEATDAGFRKRDVPYMWVIRPSDQPSDLAATLARLGLDMVEVATGMDLDLGTWPDDGGSNLPDGVEVVAVDTEQQMTDYEELIRTYWSVPDSGRDIIRTLNRYWWGARNPGMRMVAYAEGKPVAKLFLDLEAVPRRTAVYGVAVLPEARGKGLATAMMGQAIAVSKARGARKMVLHSSGMAHSLYARMGFTERCQLLVYATAPIFGTHHH